MRDDVLSWDQYFMGMAHLSAKRSKDPNTRVGACIVNPQKRVVGLGYNGFPYGCEDEEFPWDRDGEFLETKYPYNTKYLYVTHSELNAILNYRGGSLEGAKLYVSLFPCNECAKAIIQAGISCVVYESDKYDGTEGNIASKRMFHEAGVKLVQLPYEIDVETKISER